MSRQENSSQTKIKRQGSIRISLIDKFTANNIGVNIADQSLFFYRTALFIVKVEIQIENGAGVKSVQTDNMILQTSCGDVGDLHYTFTLIILVECSVSAGQADIFAVMAAVIKQNPENSFAAATNFQNMLFMFQGGNCCPFQVVAYRTGDGGSTVTMDMSLNGLHRDYS